MTFADLITRNASRISDGIAIKHRQGAMTWADLLQAAQRFSGAMLALGIKPGDRVALLSESSPGYIVAIHGTAWGGNILVPLNTRLAGKELIDQLEDCDARIVLVSPTYADATANWPEKWKNRIVSIALDGAIDAPSAKPAPRVQTDADRTQTILYTGGTTGRAKGVELSSRSMIANGQVVSQVLDLKKDDTSLLTAPMFHISGSGMVWSTAIVGASCAPLPGFSPKDVFETLIGYRASTLFLAPTMIQMLLDDPGFDAGFFASVRNLMYGASPISETLLKRVLDVLPDVRLTQAYGQTEICPLTLLQHEDHLRALNERPEILRAAGKPVDGVKIRLTDSDGRDVPIGTPGEIHALGAAIMNSYYNLPDQTNAAVKDGYVNTGDIGKFDDDGYLTLVDRSKDMIVTGGENVYSTEVENVLNAHSDVTHAAVIAVPDQKWGERVHAIVELKTPRADTELIAFCREFLAGYKCPKSIETITAMPLTPAGKIDKKPLREKYWADKETRIS